MITFKIYNILSVIILPSVNIQINKNVTRPILTMTSAISVLLPKFPRSSSEREAGSYEEATTKAKRQVREINNLHISIFFMNIVTALYTQKNERRANYSKRITARK